MKVLLISTYELGRQPFGLASPAAWLRAAGHEVACADLSRGALPREKVREAELVAFFLPMHTATRLAGSAIGMVRSINPQAHLCCYGLYAPVNETHLRAQGVGTILGGEFEPGLQGLANQLARGGNGNPDIGASVSLERLRFLKPDRTDLPPLYRYAGLVEGQRVKTTGYTEASRGCKHLCRHCPVVPVYNGQFRVVQPEVVIEDIRQQVAGGAEHITFGDPDFLNGPTHALRIVEALKREFPAVTYDVTVKVQHLLRHRDLLPVLKETGCLLVTSAVESIEEAVLANLEKGHTRDDFVEVGLEFRRVGLALAPTFVPFTPWTTWGGYRELLQLIVDLELVDSVAPVQLGLRLLIPGGSRLLELAEVREMVEPFDEAALLHRWSHPDAGLDRLSVDVLRFVEEEEHRKTPRREIFAGIWRLANAGSLPENFDLLPRAAIPHLNEPWYC